MRRIIDRWHKHFYNTFTSSAANHGRAVPGKFIGINMAVSVYKVHYQAKLSKNF
jgi:hypothetical protein